jgi:hypothetical protein
MLAAGEDEQSIRAELGLGRRAFEHRMRQLRRTAVDRHLVWARYLSGAQADLVRLEEIAATALESDPPRYGLIIRVTVARSRLRREIVEVGQLLGVYDRVAPQPRGRAGEGALRFRDLFPVSDSERAVGTRHP